MLLGIDCSEVCGNLALIEMVMPTSDLAPVETKLLICGGVIHEAPYLVCTRVQIVDWSAIDRHVRAECFDIDSDTELELDIAKANFFQAWRFRLILMRPHCVVLEIWIARSERSTLHLPLSQRVMSLGMRTGET